MAEEPDGQAAVLRIAIQGGGCSGFQYALGFDRGVQEGDDALDFHGVRVVVDPFSAPYLHGSRSTRRLAPAVRVRDQQPERRRVMRLGDSFQLVEETPPDGRRRLRYRRLRLARTPCGSPRRGGGGVGGVESMGDSFALRWSAPGPAGSTLPAPCSIRPAGRGRPDRAASDALGARSPGRRARPPELKAVSRAFERIADEAGLPVLRQRRGRPRPHTRRPGPPLRRRRLRRRRPTDRRLGIPGEDLPGSWPATEFVAWYNGHPDFQHLDFDLDVHRAS